MLKKTCLFALLALAEMAYSCTGIVRKADNGDIIYARTMEFEPQFLSYSLLFVPSGTDAKSQTQDNTDGLHWKTKYAYVGFNPFSLPIVVDGINEKGLACGGFYFQGFAEYEDVPQDQYKNSITNLDVISWVLGNFASVAEAKEAIQKTKVRGTQFKDWGIVPPIHYVIVDASGDKAVLEYVDKKLKIYDMPLGVITNSPTYDWHNTNARNYIGLRATNRPTTKLDGIDLTPLSQGSGAIGLPGDFTSPSRFIRAAFFRATVLPGKDAEGELGQTFKILNQFDIPTGSVRGESNGKVIYEETQWTSASDLANRRYIFNTYQSRLLRSVNLKTLMEKVKEMKSIPIDFPQSFQDITSSFTTGR